MTYEKAKELFATARYPEKGKPVANNTRLFDRGTHFAVRLHETDVVDIYPDGTYRVRTGGWQTVTTKERINSFSPCRVSQTNGVWYIHPPLGVWDPDMETDHEWKGGYTGDPQNRSVTLFVDDALLGPDGYPLDPVDMDEVRETERLKRKLDRMVAKYVKGFLKHIADNGGLEAPSGGDCWNCCMTDRDRPIGEPRGLAMGIDHILLHFEEKYYVPALLHNAFMENGRNPSYFWPRKGENGLGSEFWTGHALRYYLGKLKPQLLEAMRERESQGVAA